jgi:ParB family chromosome partitioning protein
MSEANGKSNGSTGRGHLVLEHAIDRIVEARSYRTDLGHLSELRASIEKLGLLCPVVITVDGVLISGRRRLAVMRELGHTTVPVWVAAGVSDELRTLLAIQDDNLLHKEFTTTEKAALYEEYKAVLAEENARRQEATRFGSAALPGTAEEPGDSADEAGAENTGAHGGWESQPPSKRKSRVQAAQAVTGKDSSQQLEEVLELQRLATDDAQDERVRQAAAEALMEINADGPVHGLFQNVKILQVLCWLERVSLDEDVASQVRDAAASEIEELRSVERRPERARAAGAAARRIADLLDRPAHPLSTDDSADADSADVDADASGPAGGVQVRGIYQARRLVDTFARVEGWWANHDPALVGVHATEEQWRLIVEHRRRAAAFLDSAEAARAEIARSPQAG